MYPKLRHSHSTLFCPLVLGLLFASRFAGADLWARPAIQSVTGTFLEGNSVTLSGTGFGNHPDYNSADSMLNYRWKNFEDQILESNGFSFSAGSGSWQIRGAGAKKNSTAYAAKFDDGQRLGALKSTQNDDPPAWYTSFWFMMPPNTQSGKFFRIYGNPQENNIYLSSGGENYMIRGFSEYTPGATTRWSSPNSFVPGQWHRVEVWMTESPNEFTLWMDGVLQWTNINWMKSPWGDGGHGWQIGNMINAGPGAYCYDDVYFDKTRARVEIGNAPVWSSCTKREIQIPLAWSDSGIRIRVNQASFEKGEGAFLFVVDADGSASPIGFPLVLGRESRLRPISGPYSPLQMHKAAYGCTVLGRIVNDPQRARGARVISVPGHPPRIRFSIP